MVAQLEQLWGKLQHGALWLEAARALDRLTQLLRKPPSRVWA
jgi:hypothetical protein